MRAWKEEANAVRLSVYAALLSLAAQTGRSKAWAGTFFQPRSGSPGGDADEDAPVDGGKTPASA